jgi:hypothetical protein
MKILLSILTLVLFFNISGIQAQNRGGHGKHRPGRVVVKRSAYRPHKVVVYHPHWRPAYAYHRRWVFFPKYNLYWDNWRNHYVFWNGSVWVTQPAKPAVIVNVNLDQEKSSELKEDEDDTDEIYTKNEVHKSEYKAD